MIDKTTLSSFFENQVVSSNNKAKSDQCHVSEDLIPM